MFFFYFWALTEPLCTGGIFAKNKGKHVFVRSVETKVCALLALVGCMETGLYNKTEWRR